MRFVIHWWMVLGSDISQVGGPRIPIVVELILIFVAPKPVKMHFRPFGASRKNGIVCDPNCCQIIGLEMILG